MKENLSVAAFAGGSFYMIEAIFNNVNGIYDIVSGYAGGHISNPTYREVCSGKTGHAETVRIEFNPDEVSYDNLLKVFMAAHNPTTLNKQGSDIGSQYRSVIFCTTDEQMHSAKNYLEVLNQSGEYKNDIVTEIRKLETFYEAEAYHQNYYMTHHHQPYSKVVIDCRLSELQNKFGSLMRYHKLVS